MCLVVCGLQLLAVLFAGCEILDLKFSLVAVIRGFITLGLV